MSLLKKRQNDVGGADGRSPPPEAFDYHSDVRPETVAAIQRRANRSLEGEEWTVIEGYVGRQK